MDHHGGEARGLGKLLDVLTPELCKKCKDFKMTHEMLTEKASVHNKMTVDKHKLVREH
eukprot:SAG31_NODE_342_length_17455_cov_6.381251_14_plen_57_part_01